MSKNSRTGTKDYVPFRESKLTTLLKQSLGGRSSCLIVACANILDQYSEETLSTLNYANKAGSIVNKPIENNDPKQRLINEQRKQINDLTIELQKAHVHINTLYQLKDSEGLDEAYSYDVDIPQRSTLETGDPGKTAQTTKPVLKPQGVRPTQAKTFDDLDETAIRSALSSTGDKSILIEKLISVLKLAREVQHSNTQLRQDIIQMSNIIDDLNVELYDKQLEIEQLQNGRFIPSKKI